MRPVEHSQMTWHKLVKCEAAKQREDDSAEKTFPGFFPADVRHHQVPPDDAPSQIRAHVGELGARNQIQHVKLAGKLPGAGTRSEIHNFGDKIVKPKHVEQTE